VVYVRLFDARAGLLLPTRGEGHGSQVGTGWGAQLSSYVRLGDLSTYFVGCRV